MGGGGGQDAVLHVVGGGEDELGSLGDHVVHHLLDALVSGRSAG